MKELLYYVLLHGFSLFHKYYEYDFSQDINTQSFSIHI